RPLVSLSLLLTPPPPRSTLFPYTTLFRSFKDTANGVPGIELRVPLLFSEGVGKGRLDLNRFVALTATNHAKLYGLYPKKGTIARSEEHTSELQSLTNLVSRLLLQKKKHNP